jgi:hypothetical protein
MRITFEQLDHPVVRGEFEPITELKGIYVFAAIPGAFNHLGEERQRGGPHKVHSGGVGMPTTYNAGL